MRHPMTPAEFDAACRELIRRSRDALSETSGHRNLARNLRVGGSSKSKHLLGMARDFVGSIDQMREAAVVARDLGLWYNLHDVGSGNHLHVQGLPPGEIPDWWVLKFIVED